MFSNDKRWVKLLKKGKSKGLHNLYEKYHAPLYYFVLDFVKSPAMAQDVVQEVFVKIWEDRSRLNPDLSFKSYLFCISKNHVINQLRRASREIKAKQYFLKHSETATNRTEDDVVYADYQVIAGKALDELPPKRKVVYMMHRQEGKKYDEIAQLLQISKNTVRDHIAKADKAIKRYLLVEQVDLLTPVILLGVATFI